MPIQASTPGAAFFADWYKQDDANEASLRAEDSWPGKHIRCLVARDISARDERFEYIGMMGQSMVPRILMREDHPQIGGDVLFIFPENVMTQFEAHRWYWCLTKGPWWDRITSVNIITGNPLIVGNFKRQQVRIIQTPELRTKILAPWADLE